MTNASVSSVRLLNTRRYADAPSWLIALLTAGLVTLLFAVSSDRLQHWFLVPVFICGALAGIDAVEWFRGGVHPFDPAGILGVYGTFALFLVPLLHVTWDFWMYEVTPPADWRDWLGYMAWLNAAGLLAYHFAKKAFAGRLPIGARASVWRPRAKGFLLVTAFALSVTAALQAFVYIQAGGIASYIEQYHRQAEEAFVGQGWIFMFSESFPILAAFAFITYISQRLRKPGWLTLGLLLAILFVLQMLFGGLRGSRLNTVLPLFWIVGAIHFCVRPVPKRVIFAGMGLLIVFLQVYAFYKFHADVTKALDSSEEVERMSRETGYSFQTVLLGDLGRADVQAYMLYKQVTDFQNFSYAHGRTYLFAISLLIPQRLLPVRPASKLKEGTAFQWGPGSYEPGLVESRRVYGLAGEAMMNFSLFAVPFAYALLGLLVARFSAWIRALHPGDLRLLLAPLGVYICFSALNMDSDIIVFTTVKNSLMPSLFVVAIATRFRIVRGHAASERPYPAIP